MVVDGINIVILSKRYSLEPMQVMLLHLIHGIVQGNAVVGPGDDTVDVLILKLGNRAVGWVAKNGVDGLSHPHVSF